MSNRSSTTCRIYDPMTPVRSQAPLPAHLERMIAARWKWWAPWVRMHLLRLHDYDMAEIAAETARLRQRQAEHILAMRRAGIAVRLIRRHRLDDPRITDEVRAMLIRSVMERQRKARVCPREDLSTQINIAAFVPGLRTLDIILPENAEPAQASPHVPRCAYGPQELQRTIESIRKRVCEQFHLAEMRDPDLKLRTHRHVFVLARQLAMYIVRQVTGASLQEIGREFGGRHHSTVLHSINKIEQMRRTDEALSHTITRLVGAVVAQA